MYFFFIGGFFFVFFLGESFPAAGPHPPAPRVSKRIFSFDKADEEMSAKISAVLFAPSLGGLGGGGLVLIYM